MAFGGFFRKLKKRVQRGLGRLLSGPKKGPKKRPALKPKILDPETRLLEHIDQIERSQPLLPEIPVFSAIEEFSGVQLSAHTTKAYKKDLEDFFRWLRIKNLYENWNDQLRPIHIAAYRGYLVEDRKLSKSTVTRKVAVLKSFFKWGKSRGWLMDNPAELIRGFPQTQESKTGFLNDEEVDRLLFMVTKESGDRMSRHLNRIACETLLMLGLRRSEACAISLGDMEFSDFKWLIKIKGKGDRARLLPLPPRLMKSWSEWIKRIYPDSPSADFNSSPREWVDYLRRQGDVPLLISTRAHSFAQRLSSSELARRVRHTARRAAIVNRVSPHVLRATAITHALDQGASHRGVQQMAGWTSPLMISRYDKRRKDPKFSAVHHLKYAQEEKKAPAPEEPAIPEEMP